MSSAVDRWSSVVFNGRWIGPISGVERPPARLRPLPILRVASAVEASGQPNTAWHRDQRSTAVAILESAAAASSADRAIQQSDGASVTVNWHRLGARVTADVIHGQWLARMHMMVFITSRVIRMINVDQNAVRRRSKKTDDCVSRADNSKRNEGDL